MFIEKFIEMQCDPVGVEYVLVYVICYKHKNPSGSGHRAIQNGIHFFNDLINPEGIWCLWINLLKCGTTP